MFVLEIISTNEIVRRSLIQFLKILRDSLPL